MGSKDGWTFSRAALAALALTLASGAALAENATNINPSSWQYGPRNDDTSGGLIWNPVKRKLLAGGQLVGRTMQSDDLATMNQQYCNLASEPGADFTWTEMQHSGIDWGDAWRMWAYGSSANCPGRVAVPGVRVAYTNEREIQHALDGGAMVLVVPTVDTEEEAREVVQWAYYPPMGRRSQGSTQVNAVLGSLLQGANYRQTFNNNLVLIVMIETIEGARNAAKIAQVPGVHGVFAASSDLGNFSGYAEGDPPYESLVAAVQNAGISAGKRVCGPYRWAGVRPAFTCFQN